MSGKERQRVVWPSRSNCGRRSVCPADAANSLWGMHCGVRVLEVGFLVGWCNFVCAKQKSVRILVDEASCNPDRLEARNNVLSYFTPGNVEVNVTESRSCKIAARFAAWFRIGRSRRQSHMRSSRVKPDAKLLLQKSRGRKSTPPTQTSILVRNNRCADLNASKGRVRSQKVMIVKKRGAPVPSAPNPSSLRYRE